MPPTRRRAAEALAQLKAHAAMLDSAIAALELFSQPGPIAELVPHAQLTGAIALSDRIHFHHAHHHHQEPGAA